MEITQCTTRPGAVVSAVQEIHGKPMTRVDLHKTPPGGSIFADRPGTPFLDHTGAVSSVMPYRMFTASSDFFSKFTELNDFVQVCAASVWTMRWQVKGYFAETGFYDSPSKRPSEADLRSRFLIGSGVESANFRSLVDGRDWLEQKAILAQVTLLGMVSLYEGWCSSFAEEVGMGKEKLEGLQWPSAAAYARYDRNRKVKPGIGEALSVTQANRSDVMTACFWPGYTKNAKYAPETQDSLLVVYRYWKELRNSLTHSAGKITKYQYTAQKLLEPLSGAALKMGHLPRLRNFEVGDIPVLDLREVLQFGEVIQRIVTIADVDLSCSSSAEVLMLQRWEHLRTSHPVPVPSNSPEKRRRQLKVWAAHAFMAPPVELAQLDEFLTDRYGVDLRVSASS